MSTHWLLVQWTASKPMLQVNTRALEEQLQACQDANRLQAGRASKLDEAVQALHSMSAQGQLAGTLHGRLDSAARVSSHSALMAVNAVLSDMCNLVSG